MATKRKPITITGTTAGAQTNFQLAITLAYDADMQADFSDVRFFAADGTTALDFWLESYTASTTATFWVEVPSIPANPSTVGIYAYYGTAGDPGGSNGAATFLDFDDFARATLNDATATWTKSGSNPLTAAGYMDPGVYYEGGTFYLYASRDNGGTLEGIYLFTSPDGTTLTAQGEVVPRGAGGTWDDYWVTDPSVVKVGSTYHLYYSATDGSGAVTAIKIGHATASSPSGPWTKDAANPVFSKASNGVNEPTVVYDAADTGHEFKLVYTYATTTGNGTDVDHYDLGYAYSSDGSSWTDGGRVSPANHKQDPGASGDQFPLQDSAGLWHLFVNDGTPAGTSGNMYQALGRDVTAWGVMSPSGVVPKGAGGSYDSNAVWAAGIVLVGGTYYLYYQAVDGSSNQKIALATSTSLGTNKWHDQTGGGWTISSGRLFKSSGTAGAWKLCAARMPVTPPYVVEADIEISAAAAGDIGALYVGQASSNHKPYVVVFGPSSDHLAIWEKENAAYQAQTSSYAVNLSTAHKMRVTVTATAITVDWFDGTTWQNGALTYSVGMETSGTGFGGYNTTANQFYGDNFRVRKYASPAPTSSVGAEENVPGGGSGVRSFVVICA